MIVAIVDRAASAQHDHLEEVGVAVLGPVGECLQLVGVLLVTGRILVGLNRDQVQPAILVQVEERGQDRVVDPSCISRLDLRCTELGQNRI